MGDNTKMFKIGNNSLLSYVKPIMWFLGTLPHELVNIDKRVYIFYKYFMQGTFFIFLILFYANIPNLHGTMAQVFQSVSIISIYSTMYIKGLVCLSKTMRKLIVEMVANESNIKANRDPEILKIYESVVKRSKRVQIFYIILTYSSFVSFFAPAVKYLSWDETQLKLVEDEDTILPYKMKIPLNVREHYFFALSIETYCALLATNYYCFIQCILVVLPLNITLRLKILNHNIRKINPSKKLLGPLTDDDLDGIKKQMRDCIEEHNNVIRNCSILNGTIKHLMLLEFLVSSAQISVALIQLITTSDSEEALFALIYLFQLLVQLLILYWHADEIREESVALCDALYEIDWYEYNGNVNRSIQIMMIRCQKPLSLTVGPFGEMSLAMAVKIMKAAYTYVTFMRQTYSEK